ncbi:hypothetical protein GCM10025859_67730 [Alicyclobacillus fastidiosus]|nr:hypothetical protein GCM10025859_67240 [Alicyclobacillus fastidiosus]GMA66331.1 hypothetical protein GCM10025859_67730 [Alicyclobacillus fastidiosus]
MEPVVRVFHCSKDGSAQENEAKADDGISSRQTSKSQMPRQKMGVIATVHVLLIGRVS